MARLDTMSEPMRSHLAELPCPTFDTRPWVSGPPLYRRRVAIISTAGLHRRDDRPFEGMSGDFRVIPNTCTAKDLVMTHVSTNFDRTGFQQDWNVVFPLDRIRELAYDSTIGSVAKFHYSFMGAADPAVMETAAEKLAGLLTGDQVDAALLVPVWPFCTRAVGALSHYLETRGIPTTQISLIREHTQTIQPPRALWVPFVLGRPLGLPGDPDFQQQVVQAALALLEAQKGPVLVDFPHDVPEKTNTSRDSMEPLACPVSFAGPVTHATGTEKLLAAFKQEVSEFRSWYDIGLEKRGYSAVIYFPPEAALQVFTDFLSDTPLTIDENLSSTALALRFAAQDIKAIYFESVMFRPDMVLPDDAAFTSWFWQKTAAGALLRAVKEKCSASEDKALKMTGEMLLVPLDQA